MSQQTEEDIDSLPLEREDLPDVLGQEPSMEETVTPRPARARKPAKATALGPGAAPACRKASNSSIRCRFLQELIQANAGLTQQVQTLAIRQQQLEKKTMMPAPMQPPYTGPFEPDYLICPQQSPQTSAVAKAIGIPPDQSSLPIRVC